jgi:phosphoglycolate phosphatase
MDDMKYKLVIFDFDGTLADSYPWFLSIFQDLAKRYRLPSMGPGDLEKLRTLDIRQILSEYKVPLWKVVMIGNHLKKLMSSQIEKINLVDGMQSVIEELGEQNIKLAVVTSNAEKNVRRVLGPQNMAYFSVIETGVSMFGKKSKFQKVLKKTGIAAGEALSIGDEIRDLKSAQEAKIPFGAVSWGYTALKTLRSHSPDEEFDHPDQILRAVSPARAPASVQRSRPAPDEGGSTPPL